MNGVWQKLRSVVPFWGKATSLGMPVGHSWFLWLSHSIFFFFFLYIDALAACLCVRVSGPLELPCGCWELSTSLGGAANEPSIQPSPPFITKTKPRVSSPDWHMLSSCLSFLNAGALNSHCLFCPIDLQSCASQQSLLVLTLLGESRHRGQAS